MMKRTLTATAAAALAAAATLAFAAPAQAAAGQEDAVTVRIADLDLADPADAAVLDRRVKAAARELCGDVPGRDLDMQKIVRTCHDEVLANARQDVGAALAAAERRSAVRLALRR
jgi:UrcA family protein